MLDSCLLSCHVVDVTDLNAGSKVSSERIARARVVRVIPLLT